MFILMKLNVFFYAIKCFYEIVGFIYGVILLKYYILMILEFLVME